MTIKTRYCLLHPVLFLMMLSAAVCCSAPAGRETFVKQSGRDSGGRYVFSIDLGDSISVHTLEFYTMIDASDRDFDAMPAMIPLRIEAVSPSGEEYSENRECKQQFGPERRGVHLHSQWRYIGRSGLTPTPGLEVERGEVEGPGQYRYASQCDDYEAYPYGEPVFCPPELRPGTCLFSHLFIDVRFMVLNLAKIINFNN